MRKGKGKEKEKENKKSRFQNLLETGRNLVVATLCCLPITP